MRSTDKPTAALRALEQTPPRDFTRQRDALAKQLTARGQIDEAKRVRAMRRPSPSVWAVAALSRAAPKLLEELLAAGAEVIAAQHQALAGRGGDALRKAGRRLQRAVDVATDRAEELLLVSGEAASASTVEKIHATLLAAATGDRDERARLKTGGLGADRVREGFGPADAVPPAPKKQPRTLRVEREHEQARKKAEARVRAAQREWEEQDQALQRAEKTVHRARALEESARRKLDAARDELARISSRDER